MNAMNDSMIRNFFEVFEEPSKEVFNQSMDSLIYNASIKTSQLWKIAKQSKGFKILSIDHFSNYSIVRLTSKGLNKVLDAFVRYTQNNNPPIESVEFYLQPDPRPFIPEKVGDQTQKLKFIKERIDQDAKEDRFSGNILIGQGNSILSIQSYGYAEKSFEISNIPQTKFHLGSSDKMFTSVAIAQLVDQGMLTYTSKLRDILTDYPQIEYLDQITIDHLLNHRAGLGGLFERPLYIKDIKYSYHKDYFPIFAESPLYFPPGDRWYYSNEGYIVLGAIIEEITGIAYADYVKVNIFENCNMANTSYHDLNMIEKNRATGYLRDPNDTFGIEGRRSNIFFVSLHGNACGGGYSTAEDMYRFLSAFKEGKLCSYELVQKIVDKRTLFDPHNKTYYGYGFQIREFQGKTIIGHGGGGPNSGINSEFLIGWEDDFYVSVLGNYDAPIASVIANEIMEILIQ